MLGRLLSSAGTILIVAVPAAGLAQVAVNTARVALPAGTFEAVTSNNEATDSDALLAVIVAGNDNYTGIRSGIGNANVGNVFGNDTVNGNGAGPGPVALTVTSPASNPGVVLDPATGQVSVTADVPAGTYTIGYRICERANPTNCADAVVTVVVDPAISSVAGTVYDDRNGNQNLETGENRRDSWIVEIIRDGAVVATTRSDAQGNYRFDGLLSGPGYSIQFRNPDNNVVYRIIRDITLQNNATLTDQNLPLDPSGVVYDSITRTPVRGSTVTLLGANGSPLPGTCFLSATQQGQITDSSGQYRFDLVPGAAAQCPVGETLYTIQVGPPTGYSGPSTVILSEPGPFDPTGMSAPVLIGATSAAPSGSDPTRHYLTFRIAQGDPDVIFNHIPLDPFTSRAPLVVTKTSIKRAASVGDLVPYTITVRNAEAAPRAGVDVVDILPPGFKYVTGTAAINGTATEPQMRDRELRWPRMTIPANGTLTITLTTVVGAGVTQGDRVNNGLAQNNRDGSDISNRGQAVISVVPSAVFDCAEVIGKVYDDRNGNGYQDEGEPGIPGARVATVNGELITTDQFGRYHIACAAVPDAQIGSNFVLKLDVRSIPQGFAPTTDNPQSIRLTRGKISELNFGIQKAATTTLDVGAQAFVPGTTDLRSDVARQIASLKPDKAVRMAIQINYRVQPGEDWSLAERRVAAIKDTVSRLFSSNWDAPEPTIEVNLTRAFGTPGRE